MKKLTKILALVLTLCLCFTLLVACTDTDPCKDGHDYGTDGKCTGCGKTQCEIKGSHTWVNAKCSVCGEDYDIHDYVSDLKLDMNSNSAKYEGDGDKILKQYVDGDTTHFWVPKTISDDGILKARYIAVNTPESTGKVEPYGKIASNFTNTKLQSALANGGNILLESDSDDGKWNHDSYGRYLVWVWYQPEKDAEYRNLNLELLQEGLAFGSNSGANRYGETCAAALSQAVIAKLVVQSGVPDETFYYGEAIKVSMKELRTNLQAYDGIRVAFEGTVTMLSSGGSYLEDMDEDGLVYGMYVYYGTEGTPEITKWLGTPGTRLLVVGVLQNFYGSWQVSDVQYRSMKPNDPKNLQFISDGHEPYYQKIDSVADFLSYRDIPVWDEEAEENIDTPFQVCELILNTTVSMDELTVVDMYTTSNGGSNDGSISITCVDANGDEITIRTGVLYKADGTTLVKESDFTIGGKISVRGVVDYYSDGNNGKGQYQIKVLRYSDITFVS